MRHGQNNCSFFELPKLIFGSFFHNLSESEREIDHSRELLKAKLTQRPPALIVLRKFFSARALDA